MDCTAFTFYHSTGSPADAAAAFHMSSSLVAKTSGAARSAPTTAHEPRRISPSSCIGPQSHEPPKTRTRVPLGAAGCLD